MTRKEHRALLAGVVMLASAMLLLELMAFRLSAAAVGEAVAVFVGLTAPVAAALGAALLSRRSVAVGGARLARAAAHLAALAGAAAAGAVIALTWVSQSVAQANGEGEPIHVAVAVGAWWAPALFGGGALALIYRGAVAMVGRLGFTEAFGGLLACLLVPGAMAFGVPHATLAVGGMLAGAAFAFGYVGRRAKPRWGPLATLPLAVVALLAGDFGEPWVKVRIDQGRRSKITRYEWTPQGVIAVERVERGKTNVRVDRSAIFAMHKLGTGLGEARTAWRDLSYALDPETKGAALVVNSAGAREVAVALSAGHEHVDAVQLDAILLNELLLGAYDELAGAILRDERVSIHVGDGRSVLSELPGGYRRIVVLGDGRYVQAAPRLLMDQHRLFTVEAVGEYLRLLAPEGDLTLGFMRASLPVVMASVLAALEAAGETRERALDRMYVCGASDDAVLLLRPEPLSPKRVNDLNRYCKRKSGTVYFPLPQTRPTHRERERLERERRERLEALLSGAPATDGRPFVLPPPPRSELVAASWRSFRELLPRPVEDGRRSKPKPKAKPGAAEPDEAEEQVAELAPVAVAAGAAGTVLVILTLLLLIGPAGDDRRPRWSARLAFPAFGVALALSLFVATDVALTLLGDTAYAWALLIPAGLVGLGGGRLLADSKLARGRGALVLGGIGLAWLLLVYALVPAFRAASGGLGATLAMVAPLVVITAALAGAPLTWLLAAFGVEAAPAAGWCWGVHHAGWALGAALAATLVVYIGVAQLMLLAAIAYAVGLALVALAVRRLNRPAAPAPEHPAASAPAR